MWAICCFLAVILAVSCKEISREGDEPLNEPRGIQERLDQGENYRREYPSFEGYRAARLRSYADTIVRDRDYAGTFRHQIRNYIREAVHDELERLKTYEARYEGIDAIENALQTEKDSKLGSGKSKSDIGTPEVQVTKEEDTPSSDFAEEPNKQVKKNEETPMEDAGILTEGLPLSLKRGLKDEHVRIEVGTPLSFERGLKDEHILKEEGAPLSFKKGLKDNVQIIDVSKEDDRVEEEEIPDSKETSTQHSDKENSATGKSGDQSNVLKENTELGRKREALNVIKTGDPLFIHTVKDDNVEKDTEADINTKIKTSSDEKYATLFNADKHPLPQKEFATEKDVPIIEEKGTPLHFNDDYSKDMETTVSKKEDKMEEEEKVPALSLHDEVRLRLLSDDSLASLLQFQEEQVKEKRSDIEMERYLAVKREEAMRKAMHEARDDPAVLQMEESTERANNILRQDERKNNQYELQSEELDAIAIREDRKKKEMIEASKDYTVKAEEHEGIEKDALRKANEEILLKREMEKKQAMKDAAEVNVKDKESANQDTAITLDERKRDEINKAYKDYERVSSQRQKSREEKDEMTREDIKEAIEDVKDETDEKDIVEDPIKNKRTKDAKYENVNEETSRKRYKASDLRKAYANLFLDEKESDIPELNDQPLFTAVN